MGRLVLRHTGWLWQPPGPMRVAATTTRRDASCTPPGVMRRLMRYACAGWASLFLTGRVTIFATQAGSADSSVWLRARYALGVSPTSSVKRELNDPRDEQPTAMQTSVTDRSPRRSSALARSIRRVIR